MKRDSNIRFFENLRLELSRLSLSLEQRGTYRPFATRELFETRRKCRQNILNEQLLMLKK